MKTPTVLRVGAVLVVLLLAGWIVMNTRWVEVDVPDDPRGLAKTDSHYALRRVLAGVGATLELRDSLEQLPPADATLLLDSSLWDIFPERDARLRAWVENGGHLVLANGVSLRHQGHDLAWIPLSTVPPTPEDQKTARPPGDSRAARTVSLSGTRQKHDSCWNFVEPASIVTPAYERGRVFQGCAGPFVIHPLNHVVPTWALTLEPATRSPFTADSRTLAVRVAVGHGDVTAFTTFIASYNRGLLEGDNALIVVAALQAGPGRAVWIVGDEKRESIGAWMWSEARAPLLLAIAGIALALWRLAVRFGPRVALAPRARRSMGEQVRGTGHFIAGTDARALHAATRKAFEDAARKRVEAWNERDDADRIAALADSIASTHTIDRAALLASLNVGAAATLPQILTAIAVLEQARRALLRAPAPPLTS